MSGPRLPVLQTVLVALVTLVSLALVPTFGFAQQRFSGARWQANAHYEGVAFQRQAAPMMSPPSGGSSAAPDRGSFSMSPRAAPDRGSFSLPSAAMPRYQPPSAPRGFGVTGGWQQQPVPYQRYGPPQRGPSVMGGQAEGLAPTDHPKLGEIQRPGCDSAARVKRMVGGRRPRRPAAEPICALPGS